MADRDVEQYPSLFNRPRNLTFLPILVLLHQAAASFEILYGIWFYSFAFFTHGTLLILISIMLFSRFVSVLVTWREQRYYSFNYVEPSLKLNVNVGLVSGCFAILYFYVALHGLFRPMATPPFDATSFLVPVPGFLVNLLTVYAIVTPYGWPTEQSIAEKRSVERMYNHLVACSFGSFGVVIACILIHTYNFVVADATYTLFNAALILLCAFNLIRESIERSVAVEEGDIFFLRYYVKNNLVGMNNIFSF